MPLGEEFEVMDEKPKPFPDIVAGSPHSVPGTRDQHRTAKIIFDGPWEPPCGHSSGYWSVDDEGTAHCTRCQTTWTPNPAPEGYACPRCGFTEPEEASRVAL